MPKYLALNYVSLALQQRRALLDRTLLPFPGHIEYVDAYVHRGDPPSQQYLFPWQLDTLILEECTSFSHVINYGCVQDNLGDDSVEVNRLVNFVSSGRYNHLEDYEIIEEASDIDSDIDIFSDEFDIAIDRKDNRIGRNEDFPYEIVHLWYPDITGGLALDLLELPECHPHIPSLLQLLPTIQTLVGRLKPKLVQDPFLDQEGEAYTYEKLAMSDFCLTSSPSTKILVSTHKEIFTHELLTFSDNERDGQFESPLTMTILSPSLPLISDVCNTLKLEEEVDLLEDNEGNIFGSSDHVTHLSQPDVSSQVINEATNQAAFYEINNTGIGMEDSGIGAMLLESPCLSELETPYTSNTCFLSLLNCLDLFPLSPENERLVLLTPSQEKQLFNNLQKQDRLFDNIASFILPYPDMKDQSLDNLLLNQCLVHEVREIIKPKMEIIGGDQELSLPWDPIAYSHECIIQAQCNLVSLVKEKDIVREGTVKEVKEMFAIELDVGVWMEGTDPPLDITTITRPVQQYYQRHCNEQKKKMTIKNHTYTNSSLQLPHSSSLKKLFSPKFTSDSGMPGLETFLMLRTATNDETRHTRTVSTSLVNRQEDSREKDFVSSSLDLNDDDLILVEADKSVKPKKQVEPVKVEVPLTGNYKTILDQLNSIASPLLPTLRQHGLNLSIKSLCDVPLDSLKFFLKQEERAWQQAQEKSNESIYQIAVSLYVIGSVAEVLQNCSLSAALSTLSVLCQKYERVLSNDQPLASVKRILQCSASCYSQYGHPKMYEIVRRVSHWRHQLQDKKAVIVLSREFSSLSGEILDYLNTVPNLQSSMFTFNVAEGQQSLYLQALEQRFQHYNCLIIPRSSLSASFPWDQVILLIEYEPTKESIFPVDILSTTGLKEHCILHSVSEITNPLQSENDLSNSQYIILCSETVTSNAQLLRLLETKYNFVIIERDYHSINNKTKKKFSYSDIILDSSTAVLLHSLQNLSTDSGLRLLVNTVSALSTQYDHCFLILHSTDNSIYHFGGSIPVNLACLQASLAHYSKTNCYNVKVVYAFSLDEIGALVRRLADWRCHQSPMEWSNREWLKEDVSKHELFLLSFSCINTLSAQMMLRNHTLRQLLSMSLEDLQRTFPSLPKRSLQMFYRLCTLDIGLNCTVSEPRTNLSPSGTFPMPSTHSKLNMNCLPLHNSISSGDTGVITDETVSTGHTESFIPGSLFNTANSPHNSIPGLFGGVYTPESTGSIITDHNTGFSSENVETHMPPFLPGNSHDLFKNIKDFTIQLPCETAPDEATDIVSGDETFVLSGRSCENRTSLPSLFTTESTARNNNSNFVPTANPNTSLLQRKPMKALDLGFESAINTTPLQTNDRPLLKRSSQLTNTPHVLESTNTQPVNISSNKQYSYLKEGTFLHSPSTIPTLPSHIHYGTAMRTSLLGGNDHQQVPTSHFSPSSETCTVDHSSFYNSSLSFFNSLDFPPPHKARRLSCQRIPGRNDGQTKLVLN